MVSKTYERLIRDICREKGYSIRNGHDELHLRDEREGSHDQRNCYLARNDFRAAFEAVITREAGRSDTRFVWITELRKGN